MPQIQGYKTKLQDSTSSDLLEVTVETDSSDRILLHTKPTIENITVRDLTTRDLLAQILKELQILNTHQEIITDNVFEEEDIMR